MGGFIDLTGQKFNRLLVLERAENKGKKIQWLCKCDCGIKKVIRGCHLKRGLIRSCGCLNNEARSERKTIHGLCGSGEYNSWAQMKQRCLNPNNQDYPMYGGSGIKMQTEWQNSFAAFFDYIGPKPTDTHYSIDRIDSRRGYEEGNVRWATDEQQARNRGKSKSNTSGTTGVEKHTYPKTNGSEYVYWVARWVDLSGASKTKSFSVNKYGEELAEFLAIEFRDKKMWELNKLGAGYTPHHGK